MSNQDWSAEAGPSRSQSSGLASQSVHIPESPGSPNILDPDDSSSESLQFDWPDREESEPQNQPDSETYTQAEPQPANENPPRVVSDAAEDSNDSASNNNNRNDASQQTVDTDRSDSPQPSSSHTASNNAEATDDTPSLNAEVRNRDDDVDEPPAKVRKISQQSNEDVDGETCPICLDSWGNTGEHRLVALKCGHLFGMQCVQKWLRAQAAKDRSCPTCKTKTCLRDIRPIYARKIVAADTTEITKFQAQIETLKADKMRVELELQKSRISQRACVLQLEVLRNTLMKSQRLHRDVRKSWRFSLEKNLEIFKDGGCRVLTYNCRTYELYVSQKSMNYLFPGYGIRKVSCVDYKLGQFVHLHSKPIRDLTYSQPRDLLLSVGLDSSAKIVERGILSTTIQSGFPLWSCSWDYLRSNEFYVGGVGGDIHQYDVRNPSTYLHRLESPGDISPVISVRSTEFGLLSCQLNSCWLWVANNNRQWVPQALPVEGKFMSLCYDNESHRAVVSCRAGASGERARLAVYKIKASYPHGDIHFETEPFFSGSQRTSLMSRAAYVKAPSTSWIAAHSESDSTLYLHGMDGARTISLPASEPALDVTSVELNGDTLVAALSESRLRLYKAVPMAP